MINESIGAIVSAALIEPIGIGTRTKKIKKCHTAAALIEPIGIGT